MKIPVIGTLVKGVATVGTVTFSGTGIPTNLRQILAIIHAPTGTVIYQANDATKLGTYANPVLTLAADTTALTNTAELICVIEDGNYYNTVDPLALSYLLDSIKTFPGYTPSGTDVPSVFRNTSVGNTKVQVSGIPCNLFLWNLIGPLANVDQCFLKFYNDLAVNITVGASTPVLTVPLDASTASRCASNIFSNKNKTIHYFDTAMTIAVTKLLADSDATAPTSNIQVGLRYK
jgi:hypothetical protein